MDGYDATKLLMPCCTTVLFFCRISLICRQLRLNSLFLCSSVRMAESGCFWFVAQNWKISPQNDHLLLRIEELNRKIILSLPTELIVRAVLIIYSDSWAVCLFISPLVPLSPLVGLRPPSNSFILSFRLTITVHLCLLLFRTQLQKAFSHYAVALPL